MSWIPGWGSVASSAWWSGFYFWVSIVCLIGLGVAEVVSHRYEGRKDQLAAIEEAAKDKRHDEDMARVQHDTAQANERAAQLEKDAANARLETERLKQTVAWRTIPPQVATTLENALAAKPGSVNLRYTDGDPESLYLAIQFSQIFTKAKWQVAPGSLKLNAIVFGIFLPDIAGDGQSLRAAFSAANIAFTTEPLPASGSSVSFNVATITGAPMLLIGSKPPAVLSSP
jgi:hypothetical protein